jgi:tetratricopeptide (TPR) repeat protein
MKWTPLMAAVLAVSATACGPRIQPLRPVMTNGAVLPSQSEVAVAQARAEGEAERARIAAELDATAAAALRTCGPTTCDAVARGELALGMNQAEVLAATRTVAAAWDIRGDGRAMVMVGRLGATDPSDAHAEIAYVTLQNDAVRSYTYREPQGLRTVTSRADETAAGRAAAQADALLRQGDDYVTAGDLSRALDRYDRADILRPGHAETTLRIARTLDKSLRPLEAAMRYRLFIHQLELERIHAHGDAAAKIAEAITRAQERIIVLERRR